MNYPPQIPIYISHPIHAINNHPDRDVIVAIIKVVDMALLVFAAVGGVAVGVEVAVGFGGYSAPGTDRTVSSS